MVREAVARLHDGGQLLVFPEGTRTVTPPINALKGAFALIAKKSGKPVQLIDIETDSPYLRKGWPLWRRPDIPLRYCVRLSPRIDPSGSTDDIMEKTRTAFEQILETRRTPDRPKAYSATDYPIDA